MTSALESPDGKRQWTPETPAQATNLRARGWAPKADKAAAAQSPEPVAPKPVK